ncbi:molybdate ABC transporter substrate-binding protein [Pseudoneobacillus sp. C159]
MKKLCLSIAMILLILSGCTAKDDRENQKASEKQVELTVSAAASLQNALDEIKANFEEEYSNVKIFFNFGASGALQQQIAQGAPVDLFFSAAEDKFDALLEKGLINPGQGIDLVGNELVLVVPKDGDQAIKAFEDLPKAKKVSIGTPETVPAGKYAKETLENIQVWPSLEDKVVYAKDVRQVLTYVETNNIDAGIVYKTDALISSKVDIVATAPETAHAPIIYPVGMIKKSSHKKEAQLFYEYLQKDESIKVFEKYGFKSLK